jgi:Kef-type K+ transport system membrane component KefB
VNLAILFGLAALAISTHVSIMLAGFALGLVVASIGQPRRLARQLFGITEGFFGPLFFVWLGASLQVRDLVDDPQFILLGVALGVGAILAHAVGRILKQPMTLAVLSAAQLGVPVAAATVGTEERLLLPGEPAALVLGALITIAATSAAGVIAARTNRSTPQSGARSG